MNIVDGLWIALLIVIAGLAILGGVAAVELLARMIRRRKRAKRKGNGK